MVVMMDAMMVVTKVVTKVVMWAVPLVLLKVEM